jgi:hypothetical protein
MYPNDPFTPLRAVLRHYHDSGRLRIASDMARDRFLAYAEIDLLPLCRRLCHVLRQEGLSAQDDQALDDHLPWIGVWVDTDSRRGLFLLPGDEQAMQLIVRRCADPVIETSYRLDYRHFTPSRLAQAVETVLPQILWPDEPPL